MPSLGIDFGTSTTRVAIREEPGLPAALPIGSLAREYIPSVVAFGSDGRLVATGEAALNLGAASDALVIENIKRCLMYQIRPDDNALLPDWWDRQQKLVRLPGFDIAPEEIIVAIIEEALNRAVRASRLVGTPIDDARIRGLPASLGAPAETGYDMRERIVRIAKRAGLQDISLGEVVDEPSLAAMAFAGLQELGRQATSARDRRTVLVYDLGGGTFDVALVDVRPGQGPATLTVLASSSLPFLGGADIDEAFLKYLRPQVARELGFEGNELESALHFRERQQLSAATRALKEELSFADRGTLTLLFLSSGATLLIPVTRAEFDDVLKDTHIIEKTLDRAVLAYRQARMYLNREDGGGFFRWEAGEMRALTKEGLPDMNRHITDVVLVGGSTNIPAVRQALESAFPGKIVSDRIVDPITANAQGATIVRDGYLPGALDNCGYWVEVETGTTVITLHKPFDRYLHYRLGMLPKAVCSEVKNVPIEPGVSKLRFRSARGDLVTENDFESDEAVEATFEFDELGAVKLTSGWHTLVAVEAPPWQHESQALIRAERAEKVGKAEEERHKAAIEKVQQHYSKDVN